MADRHDALIIAFRKKILRGGFRLAKSPMPTYRPDIFAEKVSREGKAIEQIVVEAEIPSTIFSEHTSHQLVIMDEFIRHQVNKGISVAGFLLIPTGREPLMRARGLLDALFPLEGILRIRQI
jgi:hypothetical protein